MRRRKEIEMHTCTEPKSNNFEDSHDAQGCWMDDGKHFEQVVGDSGIYLIVTDEEGNVVRDDRPWQLLV